MKFISKIADWIVAKSYRYWIAQWLLYTVLFFSSTLTVACFYSILTK